MDMLNDILQWLDSWGLTDGQVNAIVIILMLLTIVVTVVIPLIANKSKKDTASSSNKEQHKVKILPVISHIEDPVARVEDTKHGEQTTELESTQSSDNKEKDKRLLRLGEGSFKSLPHTSKTKLFGRTKELSMLTRAWHNDKKNIVVLKAMGGTGKTALLKTWLDGFNDASKRTPPDKIHTWSFYSQGSAEDKQASADEFFNNALNFFGYQGDPIASAHDKGIKLAELINQQRILLVLDGLEPLQNPVGVLHGDLKDKGLIALLQQLAAHNKGLCLISSRQTVVELSNKPLVLSHDLEALQTPDGVALLKSYGVHGAEAELTTAVEEVKGHALALNLLGNYIYKVFDGDIRQRDKIIHLSEDDAEGSHAEHVMAAYEKHLKGTAELHILYLLGLFDRPVSITAFSALLSTQKPSFFKNIFTKNGLYKFVQPIKKLSEKEWKVALANLRQQQLLNTNTLSLAGGATTNALPLAGGAGGGRAAVVAKSQNEELTPPNLPFKGRSDSGDLDTHPLIREYFSKQLKQHYPEAWQQAHRQLYQYYKALPEKQHPDTLEEMQPLFTAIAHGCAAGMYQQALDDVYFARVQHEGDNYLGNKLGAFSTGLSVLSHFFSQHWQTPTEALTDEEKAAVLNWVATYLRALGRLQEAVEPMQASLDIRIKQEKWQGATVSANNLSELQLVRGELRSAIAVAEQGVEFSDKSEGWNWRMSTHPTLADALHQVGEVAKALNLFSHEETLQKLSEFPAEIPPYFSLSGFKYCDCLLSTGQWGEVLLRTSIALYFSLNVSENLLDIALHRLSLGQASLQQSIAYYYSQILFGNTDKKLHFDSGTRNGISKQHSQTGVLKRGNNPIVRFALAKEEHQVFSTLNRKKNHEIEQKTSQTKLSLQSAKNWLNQAVDGLRKAGQEQYLSCGLLARASYYHFCLALPPETLSNLAGSVECNEADYDSGMAVVGSTKLHRPYDASLKLALADLQETHDIAQRGGMLLFLCDYHLESARLALSIDQPVHNQTASEHTQKAKQLIEDTGYKRRLPEVEYLEVML